MSAGSQDAVRVVVAEDESIIRLDLVETLREEGFDVVADTGRGDEAVALVAEHRPDVAILDVKMPGLDGIEAARRIAPQRGTAVVILTAFSQRELIEQAREAGAMTYLVKPYRRDALVPAVDLALARFKEMEALEGRVGDLEDRLEVRKLLDRAKGRLIDGHGMSEQDAYVFIQRTAMSQRRTMQAVAEDVLEDRIAP
ncbi:MAG: response regulator [Acidimicrobiaceae bacterium]|nr:response regulator [Acidimicrobiaceae bacterium]MCY3650440.1 response regulator [Acidimicrobiaceae bacterium]MDE0493378.1 response regulator [Acidimicrobiaceae bacterium]MDE0666090.1 response regulator [Acidimicrobiaceae bacterium]MXW89350.1 response regulator [Acidimicrobiaceae bacterium]